MSYIFFNFIGAFGDGSSNQNSHFEYKKGAGTHENYRNRIIDAIIEKFPNSKKPSYDF